MSRLKISVLVAALALASGGCLGQAHLSGGYQAADPILVELQPGVWVIEDYDQPVFYADGFFWMYRDDGWYRSRDHVSGWAYVRAAPQVVVRIERPRQYVHFRATVGARVRRGPSGPVIIRGRDDDRGAPRGRADDGRGQVRPPRAPMPAPPPPARPPAAPPPRDHQRTDPPGQRDDRDPSDQRDDQRDDRPGKDQRDDQPARTDQRDQGRDKADKADKPDKPDKGRGKADKPDKGRGGKPDKPDKH
ncbi:MAG: hypothetical protein IPH80_35810 [Myxococcales bacterium]|nr:hypothetical protein [Myxococcales bacterium]MBP6846308.1 hypothetical protein [Kofleriaceae bacterium]